MPTFLKNLELVVEQPESMDILCGSKSSAVASHPGNVAFRRKIEDTLEEYETIKSNMQDRITLNRSIIAFMKKKHGSRFLKSHKGSWILAEERTIRVSETEVSRGTVVRWPFSHPLGSTYRTR